MDNFFFFKVLNSVKKRKTVKTAKTGVFRIKTALFVHKSWKDMQFSTFEPHPQTSWGPYGTKKKFSTPIFRFSESLIVRIRTKKMNRAK